MSEKTALYDLHIQAGGKIVDFAGFALPINYGSQLDEHHAVRSDAGMFDVSHMVVSDLSGGDAKSYLQFLLANDVAKLTKKGKALYSCMLNETGGVIDDLIVYWLGDDQYRIISNAATKDKDLAWMQKQISAFDATLIERFDWSMIAVQGPNACAKTAKLLPEGLNALALGRFFGAEMDGIFVGRTGYTGEDGFEIVSDGDFIQKLWQNLIDTGVKPCGLGARDTLRLEAGMMLYGNDLDETHNPMESGVAWSVANKDTRDFIGKSALVVSDYHLVGLMLNDKGVMRSGQKILHNNKTVGVVTSGGYSPILDKSIAFARIQKHVTQSCEVQIRSKLIPATITSLMFVKHT